MANPTPSTAKKKRRPPLGKRQLSAKVSYSNLWIPDKQLLGEIAKKRQMTDAELIREIIHQWAIKKRLAPDTDDGAEEVALIDLQRETKSAVETGIQEITERLNKLLLATSGFGDLLSLNEAQLTHIGNVSNTHYNITGQTFAAVWFLVEMTLRLGVEKSLPTDNDRRKTAIALRDDIRADGLRMLDKLIKESKSPQSLLMALLCPSGE